VHFSDTFLFRYSISLKDASREGIRKAVMGGVTGGLFWLIIFGIFALAFWYGAKLTRDDCMEPGAVLQVMLRSFWDIMTP